MDDMIENKGQKIDIDLPLLKKFASTEGKALNIFDLETTTFVGRKDFGIVEVGALRITPESDVYLLSSLVNPENPISKYASEVTGITDRMVVDKFNFADSWAVYFQVVANEEMSMGFNSISFDCKGVSSQFERYFNKELKFNDHIDVRSICSFLSNGSNRGKLTDFASDYGVKLKGDAHRAGHDVMLTALLCESIAEKEGFDILYHETGRIDTKHVPGFIRNLRKENENDTKKVKKSSNAKIVAKYIKENGYSNPADVAKGCDLSLTNMSFGIADALKYGYIEAEDLVIEDTQDWLNKHVPLVIEEAWFGVETGRLKPLMEELKKLDNFDNSVDYTQLRVYLSFREKQKMEVEPTHKPKIKP